MKWAAIVLSLLLALALAKAVLTVLGLALAFAVVVALIVWPRHTVLLAGELGLLSLVLAYPWAAALTAVVLVVGLAVLKRQRDRPHNGRLRLPPS